MSKDTVGKFFNYQAAALQNLINATREAIAHAPTKGTEAETALAHLLASLLPKRFDAGKGFILDSNGAQSSEIDLVVVDRDAVARMFDFRAFELVPVEAASACVEVKMRLDKDELDSTFERFQKIQDMAFFEERVIRTRSTVDAAAVVATTTSRPELVLFAYEASLSADAVKAAYARHPALAATKICILNKGIIVDIVSSPWGQLGLCWIHPVEKDGGEVAGQTLAVFLYNYFLPSLYEQTKGTRFYIKYLSGESDYQRLT